MLVKKIYYLLMENLDIESNEEILYNLFPIEKKTPSLSNKTSRAY